MPKLSISIAWQLGIVFYRSSKMSTYLQSSEGKFIPATKRPDGTWRKARRVKDGYVPQEEVPLYESKGKQFVAQRQAGVPPGMCPLMAAESKKEREKQERTRAKKQEKESGRQPKAPAPGVLVMPPSTCPPPKVSQQQQQQPSGSRDINSISKALEDTLKLEAPQEVDPAKQLKKLRKKIREIEQIESRIQAGEQKKLDKDQLDKVKKKSEILRQIKELESTPRS
ncbi:partner of Y14 and mago [Drosophila teissieri]|uniref:partner of Y14 and mago n=1 Tax=Drosophila teissieri TaxID=7243 RepID=UPI001CBA38AE|nr:partner of Y14 and mago [Drosophila teissieri]